MIRDAKFTDVPRIAELMQEAHKRSIYADTATFDIAEAKQLICRSLQRHGQKNQGATLVLVSEKDGVVEGFMVGMLEQVYPCLKELMCTDLLFILSEGAPATDAKSMLKRLIKWGESNPKVIEIHLGITNAITDWERTSKLYKRLGLKQCGGMFQKRIDRNV